MKTLENKSIQLDTVTVDGIPVVQVKPLMSMKKMSLRPRKSFTRVKSLRPLKAAGNKSEISAEIGLD
tara:strand:- start:15238 stop:15438 length:201 start_codon:yes stop_codon:yes gene_type:complete